MQSFANPVFREVVFGGRSVIFTQKWQQRRQMFALFSSGLVMLLLIDHSDNENDGR
jgi:energy-converting hydrogenase Eha subunit C